MPQGQSYPTTFLRSDNSFQDPIINNLNPNNPNFPYTALLRRKLNSATTFYFATNGSDANDGSITKPWLTPAVAAKNLALLIDFGGQNVTLQAVAGHANFTTELDILPWVGGGSLTIDFGGGSIAVTGTNINAFNSTFGALPGFIILQNGTLSAAGGNAINVNAPGVIFLGTGLTFGACGTAHIACLAAGGIVASNGFGYTISGVAQFHFYSQSGGEIQVGNITVTFTVGGAFTIFALAQIIAVINTNPSITWAFGGHVITGVRYQSNFNSVIISGTGGNQNYFPGNVVGSSNTGGQYQ